MGSEQKPKRLAKVAKECNVATTTLINFLKDKEIMENPTSNMKITQEVYEQLLQEFQPDKLEKERSKDVVLPKMKNEKAEESGEVKEEEQTEEKAEEIPSEPKESDADESEEEKKEEKQSGFKVVGKIDLSESDKPAKDEDKEEVKEEEESKETSEPQEAVVEEEAKTESADAETEDTGEKEDEVTKKAPAEDPEEETTPQAEEDEVQPEKDKEEDDDSAEKPEEKAAPEKEKDPDDPDKKGLTILGKVDIDKINRDNKRRPVASTSDPDSIQKKRRKRKKIVKDKDTEDKEQEKAKEGTEAKTTEEKKGKKGKKGKVEKKKKAQPTEIDDKQIEDKIKQTLSRLEGKGGGTKSRIKKKKRELKKEQAEGEEEVEKNILEVTEFITANELANLMEVGVTEVITTCMQLDLMVSINQRLDAETITLVADEFGYDVEFKEAEVDEPDLEEPDNPDNLKARAPIVTIMGHVDHGKTSLLDYIQKSKIIAGEAGGITQHIGAYEVQLEDGRKITYLDTPGHEAFTAMRARGAKITDVAVIVIAADDAIKPQTKEAISHAQAAGVPIVIAINKIDKAEANPEKVKEQLAELNILVEDWGGKYQCQEISAKEGTNVDELQEKVLLEAEIQELKADPDKKASGTVVEATLDKGKGVVTSVLVQNGTLHKGNTILAGAYHGKIKAMLNERGKNIKKAGPSSPVQVLGMDGTPQAGDKFYVLEDEKKAKEIALKRQQLLREQSRRTKKHITLDEIGRRLAIGNFQELNVIIKGDFEGSVEALADSLQKLTNDEVQVNVIHKAVGQISESDVLLASASDAIIIGFQVRPSPQARKLAEKEEIDIRLHSIIYDAIEEVKSALEGMLSPKIEENIIGNAEVRDVFKVSKVGTVAGCMVTEGKVKRNSKVRLIREGVVTYNGTIDTLKRFKENAKEVTSGYECGITISNFNDIKVGDEIECYEEVEVKRSLSEESG